MNIPVGKGSPDHEEKHMSPCARNQVSFVQCWVYSKAHGVVQIVKEHQVCTDPGGWIVYLDAGTSRC